MTAGDVIDTVLERLYEETAAPVFWNRAEILQHINDGMLEMTLMSGRPSSDRTFAMIGGKFQILPDGAIAITDLTYAGAAIEKTSLELIDQNNANWDSQSGLLQKWAPVGLDHWYCDRQPVTAQSVVLTTLDEPATLAEATEIDLDAEYIEALEYYAFHMARFKEGGGEFEQAMTAYDDFLAVVGHVEGRTMSQQWTLWARDTNADTGLGYSTIDRS